MKLYQTETTHIIPYDTEVISPKTHPYDESPYSVPLVYRYNTGAKCLKGNNIMSNHMAKIPPPRKIQNPTPTNTTVHVTGEDWVHTNRTTVEFKIHAGLMNTVISPETGKYEEYRHLMKGIDKPKWTRTMENEI